MTNSSLPTNPERAAFEARVKRAKDKQYYTKADEQIRLMDEEFEGQRRA